MTEYNLFCYSEKYNDENSFQQKRYRAFNKQLTEQRYREVLTECNNILKFSKEKTLYENWKSVTQEQWKQLLSIPEASDFKEGFEFISDCKIGTESLIGKVVSVCDSGHWAVAGFGLRWRVSESSRSRGVIRYPGHAGTAGRCPGPVRLSCLPASRFQHRSCKACDGAATDQAGIA